MADIALAAPNRVNIEESIIQDTQPAGENLVAGQVVAYNAAGRFVKAAANAAAGGMYGVVRRTVVQGESVTAVRKGVMEGFNLDALNPGALVYSSATSGAISDTAGTGTVLGRVIPGRSNRANQAADRLLFVDL